MKLWERSYGLVTMPAVSGMVNELESRGLAGPAEHVSILQLDARISATSQVSPDTTEMAHWHWVLSVFAPALSICRFDTLNEYRHVKCVGHIRASRGC